MLRGTRLWHYREGKRRTPPTITSSAMPDPSYGVAYSHSCTATGSTPITWSISAGALPTGLSLNAGTGAITGTPTASGAFSGTIRATNAAGYNEQAFSVVVSYLSKVLSFASLYEAWSLVGNSTYLTGVKGVHNLTNSGATPAGGAAVPFPEGGNAILLDGINDVLSIPSIVYPARGTVLLWAKMSALSGSYRTLARLGKAYLTLRTSGSYLYYALGNNAANSGNQAVSGSNNWALYSLRWDTNYIRGWKNTTEIWTSSSYTSTSLTYSGVLGDDSTTPAAPFNGSLAFAAIFSEPLSDAEITALATP